MNIENVNNITDKNIQSTLDKKLTKRNWLFIQYISKGLSVAESYKLAGYKGTNPEQPYQLNYELKHKINEYLENQGFNKEKLMTEVNTLIALPLDETKKSVTFNEKLRSLKFLASMLPETKPTQQSFSKFMIINNQNGLSPIKVNTQPIDTSKVIDSEQVQVESVNQTQAS